MRARAREYGMYTCKILNSLKRNIAGTYGMTYARTYIPIYIHTDRAAVDTTRGGLLRLAPNIY